jgi:Putative F0F1-ATPase subunit Ca2+/Mg2+ transporter
MEVGRYGSVGLELVLTILIPAGLGHWLDGRYWGNGGWGAGCGFLLGVAVGFRNLVRTAKGMQRDIERAEAKDPEGSRWKVDPSWVHDDTSSPKAPIQDVDEKKDGKHDRSN